MQPRHVSSPRRRLLASLSLAGVLDCWGPAEEPQRLFDPKALVPAGGVVTLNGEPLAGAVLTFLPETGLPGVGETDERGRYELKTIRSRGVLPGNYKVAISYMVSADGEPQGLAARNATFPSEAMVTAKEQFPPEYADLFRTGQKATVTARGATALNFDVKVATPTPTSKEAGGLDEGAESEAKGAGDDAPVERNNKEAGGP